MIAKIEITDHGHRAADLAEGCDPKNTVAGICPSRFRGCLRKSVSAVHPLRRRGTNVVAARRYVTSLRTADSVLATDNYLEANADYATDLGAMFADFVDYGRTKQRLERLAAKLEVPQGK